MDAETFLIAPLPVQAAHRVAGQLAAIHAEVSDRPWSSDGFQRLLMAPASLGLVIGGDVHTPVGFVLAQRALDEAEILMVAVRPLAQRQGLATTLLNDLHEAAALAGARRILLDVAADNVPARRLYERIGYRHTGQRKDYYGLGVDAILMAMDLPAPDGKK